MWGFFMEQNSSYVSSDSQIIGNTKLGKNCKIYHSKLVDTFVGDNVTIVFGTLCYSNIQNDCNIKNSEISSCNIDANCKVENCQIEQSKMGKNCVIKNSEIGKSNMQNDCKISMSKLDNMELKDDCFLDYTVASFSKLHSHIKVGAFCHVRPNCTIENNVKIGNFVELKNCTISQNTKIPHLAYVGDAFIGKDCNIGCGVIFCNYDGKNKHFSRVGDRVFVGSNSNIIAPVVLENDCFVASGSTITADVKQDEFAIARSFQQNKKYVLNPYSLKFKSPLKYFGTDGIRGVYNKWLTDQFCMQVGYSLSKLKQGAKILVARDTRPSSNNILNALSVGLTSGNAKVFDAGILSTAGLAYLTKKYTFDYGVMITASHNLGEYNGIKIFDKNGYKINATLEHIIEENLSLPPKILDAKIEPFDVTPYFDHLCATTSVKLKDKTILLDLSCGATVGYAQKIFEQLGAKIICINKDGEINRNASVLDDKIFEQNMKKHCADIGFAFDGDADRVMCMTKNLQLIDGDKIMLILAKHFNQHTVVGTILTNMKIEHTLLQNDCSLIRTDVGDKFISKMIKKKNLLLGAEQSGHVIVSTHSTTGDGVLTALLLCEIFEQNPKLFEWAESIQPYPTINKKVQVKDKLIVENEQIKNEIEQQRLNLGKNGRIIVRASGTEPVIRICVEHRDKNSAEQIAQKLVDIIQSKID